MILKRYFWYDNTTGWLKQISVQRDAQNCIVSGLILPKKIRVGDQIPGLCYVVILRQTTGVGYDKMLFFDDCGWGDHCGRVEKQCPGVVAVRTPNGLQYSEWEEGLSSYARRFRV